MNRQDQVQCNQLVFLYRPSLLREWVYVEQALFSLGSSLTVFLTSQHMHTYFSMVTTFFFVVFVPYHLVAIVVNRLAGLI